MNTTYNRIAGRSVERLAALSDGVFAIVMTLLILEIHVPARETVASEQDRQGYAFRAKRREREIMKNDRGVLGAEWQGSGSLGLRRKRLFPWKLTKMKNLVVITLLAQALAATSLSAAAEWRAGLATVKITPEEPVRLAGYAARVKPFEDVEQDLFARALALEDRDGQRAAIVTTDLIGLSAAVAEPVCERIREKTGLKRDVCELPSEELPRPIACWEAWRDRFGGRSR